MRNVYILAAGSSHVVSFRFEQPCLSNMDKYALQRLCSVTFSSIVSLGNHCDVTHDIFWFIPFPCLSRKLYWKRYCNIKLHMTHHSTLDTKIAPVLIENLSHHRPKLFVVSNKNSSLFSTLLTWVLAPPCSRLEHNVA